MSSPLESVRNNRVVPPGLALFLPLLPALKRWAKLGRPAGAGFLDSFPADYSKMSSHAHSGDAASRVSTENSGSWIRGHVILHLQFVEHIEIGVQLVVPLQRLQIADGGSRLHRQA